jgi:CRISPR-associated protein Cmr2
MTSYLYVLSIGPIQDFIVAARRTRDLWFGSHLLSEISKAAAREIAGSGELIFPALKAGDEDLEPNPKPGAFNVANIILAKLIEGKNPVEMNDQAKEAAFNEWMCYAEGAKNLADHLAPGFVREEMWKEQVCDVIEFYSAWVPFSDLHPESYGKDRERLMRLLDGRKAIRNFDQPKRRDLGFPKSSLDGARDSILEKNKEIPQELVLKMRLQAGEQLCAVGLTKRLGRRKNETSIVLQAFPSVVRVALDPWLRGINESKDEAKNLLKNIESICDENAKAEGKKGSKRSGYIAQGTGGYYRDNFPFDGQILHLPRIARMMKAKEESCDPREKDRDRWKGWEAQLSDEDRKDLKTIKGLVERLQKSDETENGERCFGFGEPERYFAILVADGDRMGKVISAREDRQQHRNLSENLAKFAKRAREIVESKNNHGCLVYSGGDDVLAFLPMDFCLQAARELHDCFGKLLEGFPYNEGKVTIKPTLSVGIAIGHSMEPLEDLLNSGRGAEEAAKKGTGPNDERNGLAVHLYPRSGAPTKIRERWDPEGEVSFDKRLLKWAEMHCRDELPDSAAYDMHELAEDYREWNGISREELKNLIIADSWRVLKRKKAGGTSSDGLRIEDIENLLAGVDSYKKIRSRADELILARQIASAMKQAKWNVQLKKKANEVVC